MRSYSQADSGFVQDGLKGGIVQACAEAKTLDVAAQRAVEFLYNEFENSALLRVYATVKFAKLPADNQAFVRKLATQTGVLNELKDNTLVLSLLGTRGRKREWNDRRSSQGHIGIPLVSAKFVESIPMISRLLSEFGILANWFGEDDATELITKTLGRLGAVFHVADAATQRDAAQRLIIPAQDFVAAERIKSVFGVGGAYMDGTVCAFLLFTRESLDRATADRFLPLINYFKTGTVPLVGSGKFFS